MYSKQFCSHLFFLDRFRGIRGDSLKHKCAICHHSVGELHNSPTGEKLPTFHRCPIPDLFSIVFISFWGEENVSIKFMCGYIPQNSCLLYYLHWIGKQMIISWETIVRGQFPTPSTFFQNSKRFLTGIAGCYRCFSSFSIAPVFIGPRWFARWLPFTLFLRLYNKHKWQELVQSLRYTRIDLNLRTFCSTLYRQILQNLCILPPPFPGPTLQLTEHLFGLDSVSTTNSQNSGNRLLHLSFLWVYEMWKRKTQGIACGWDANISSCCKY